MAGIRVRARALDMLGRQQIAGIPTAISELFKNAHDAYAHRVEVDFFRRTGILVLRDDGIGMPHQDFVDRWLTLGTESKLGVNFGLAPPPLDPSQAARPIMGEKGIGRLAIAAIGPQVLVLTRAKARETCDELVAAFIHWGIFGLPGVDLGDVQIPMRTFPGGSLPSATDIAHMVEEVRENIEDVAAGLPRSHLDVMLGELKRFDIDPTELYKRLSEGPTLENHGHGTHFIVTPTEETFSDDIDGSNTDDTAPPLIKVLVGFTNTMTDQSASAPILARFRDHAVDGVVTERIAGSTFFTPEEFSGADHHVVGKFDEYGQFRGNVTVYGAEPREFLLPWTGASGSPLQCGPFRINFAYVQGEARATKLPPEDHARMAAKLNRIGGLYIYRDGIRVLPYGNSDYDFLNIERRRTKSVSYYFFSYRRIFGVVDITKQSNPNLVEKAGREGFRENRAYRQLKRLLENLFVQLAAEFFREGGMRADEFMKKRGELEHNEMLRRKRARLVRTRREEFAKKLDRFFDLANARRPETEVQGILKDARMRFQALSNRQDHRELVQEFLDLESEVHLSLSGVDGIYKIPGVRGFGLTQRLQRDWEAYLVERNRLEREVFSPAGEELARVVVECAGRVRADLDDRRRLDRVIKDTGERQRRRTGALERETREELGQVQERVLSRTREGLTTVETTIRETVSEFERTDTSALDTKMFEGLRAKLEDRIVAVAEVQTDALERLREQLRGIGTEEGLELSEVTGALEEELEVLREREEAGLQLAQVGMALGIVHHEFTSTIHGVRNSLRRLKPWADANKRLDKLYQEIRSNFDHLDGYLTLFTPLDRRLQRRRVRIKGTDIHQFLMDLFGDRLKRHGVILEATEGFSKMVIVEFPSSFYPCFVNLVDNAIFWITSKGRSGERRIELDGDGEAFIVTDSGPGIRSRDADVVFDMGFTRRPAGRGMGLYISRQTLNQVGYGLTLDRYVENRGARFRIAPASEGAGESGNESARQGGVGD